MTKTVTALSLFTTISLILFMLVSLSSCSKNRQVPDEPQKNVISRGEHIDLIISQDFIKNFVVGERIEKGGQR